MFHSWNQAFRIVDFLGPDVVLHVVSDMEDDSSDHKNCALLGYYAASSGKKTTHIITQKSAFLIYFAAET